LKKHYLHDFYDLFVRKRSFTMMLGFLGFNYLSDLFYLWVLGPLYHLFLTFLDCSLQHIILIVHIVLSLGIIWNFLLFVILFIVLLISLLITLLAFLSIRKNIFIKFHHFNSSFFSWNRLSFHLQSQFLKPKQIKNLVRNIIHDRRRKGLTHTF
jgi:hypothetical protein